MVIPEKIQTEESGGEGGGGLLRMRLISKGSRQEHCTDQVAITLMMTLLPDRVTFIFPSREIVIYRFRKPIFFIFLSAREFSFPYFAFNLLKIFAKF